MKSRISAYSAWLIFAGGLLIAPNLISVNNLVRLYHFAWLDVFATAALLFGPALLTTSLAGGTMLALLETVTARAKSQRVHLLPAFFPLALFLAGWLHLLRRTLIINRVELSLLERSFELPTAVAIAALLFGLFPSGIAQWVVSTTARLRLVSTALTVALIGLLGYTLVESHYRGSTGPVQVPKPGHLRPNVIVVVLDGLTSLDMSLYGYSLATTPRLDEITRTWTVFENAHSTATATTAVQPAILTGRYPFSNDWHGWARGC
jgi:glucan phosphoethanolaminetransferase (alkaline phosphatase superfamily)